MNVIRLDAAESLRLALPKGRILKELKPILEAADIHPEAAFEDPETRKLRFSTNIPGLEIVRVRSFDVASFVAFGGADFGIAGRDVVMEFDDPEVYAPLDLGIGYCRLAVAEPAAMAPEDDPTRWSHVRIATKYPNITAKHFAARGVQAECIKLNGAMELAPVLGLCSRIVDLVSTGSTLKANGLVEIEHIADISSLLIVNRTQMKTRSHLMRGWIERFRSALDAQVA